MNPFQYVRAATVGHALELCAQPGTQFLGGGTNLIDLMKYDVERPKRLVDVTHLPMARIEPLPEGGLRVGALVRNSDLAAHPRVVADYPLLAQALLSGASPQLRNMATTAGNLLQRTRCYYFYDTAFPCNKRNPGSGCPAIGGQNRIHAILGQSRQCIATHPSDMAVALVALDATVQVQGPRAPRSIPIGALHRLPGDAPHVDTTLLPDELITAVDLPPPEAATRAIYLKVRDRASFAFALVSVAAALHVEQGRIVAARLALGGVAHKPWRTPQAEHLLVGRAPDEQSFGEAADMALEGARGEGRNDFKIPLAHRCIVRAFSQLGREA